MDNKKTQLLSKLQSRKRILLVLIISIVITVIILPLNILLIKIVFNLGQIVPSNFKILLIDTENYTLSLNDFITLTTYFIQIVVAILFSFLLWKSGQKSNEIAEKSNEIAEKLEKNERDREKNNLKENALIVFYDLKLGLNDLKKLYQGKVKNRQILMPKRLFFSDDWIKNVAIMKDELSNEDINKLYLLYGDLLTIKDLLESQDDKFIIEEIEKVSKKVFDSIYLEYAHENIDILDIESVLNLEYQCIFEKLKKIIYITANTDYKDNKIDNEFVIKDSSNKEWLYTKNNSSYIYGVLKVYNQDGRLRYDGIFENGNLINGKRYEYDINGLEFMTIQYEDGQYSKGKININGIIYIRGNFKENKFSEGYKKIFDNNNKLIYEGNLYDGKYHGKGKKYEKDGSWYDGEFNNNRFVRGIKKNVLIEDTEREYSWQREQWEIENMIDNDKYQEYQEELFEEQRQEHVIGEQIYADLEYTENGIKIIESSKRVFNKYDKEFEHFFK